MRTGSPPITIRLARKRIRPAHIIAWSLWRRARQAAAQRPLAEIQRHVLRVSCHRCERTVEIQTVDAIRLYGGKAIWKEVGQRLLDDTCQQRTGSHEDDGCWPNFGT